jgi:hypothetical protein
MNFGHFNRDAENVSEIADKLNTGLNQLSFEENMKSQAVEVEFIGNKEVEIPHSLKVTPLYRIILRQRDNINILDGDTQWTDKAIYLKTSSASGTYKVTILIVAR